MQTLILSVTLLTALALLVRAEMARPNRPPPFSIGLLVVITLALTGLLGLWDLPIATNLLTGLFGA